MNSKTQAEKKKNTVPPPHHKRKVKPGVPGRPLSKKKKRPETIPAFRGRGALTPEGIGFIKGMLWADALNQRLSLNEIATRFKMEPSTLQHYLDMKIEMRYPETERRKSTPTQKEPQAEEGGEKL